ncbi:ATP-binding cassette domain-containing protein [Saccharicrinis aurantiacus]|uniref:ATP-binding cassette domain-containing protein n=1 Tax=Saccharicrinis aurantiacus TaxID=1849719 RepID=UPI00248F92D4|nr:ATP-binding cassette domain-containing protein [Saccharicrinis aurantiacus]
MTNTLEIDSVLLEFGTHRVLQNVYLKCQTGNITGLLGRNGTGKSCLMKILFGELIPNEKSMRINGNPIYSTYRSPKDIRYLPQSKFAPNSLTVKRILSDFKLDFEDLISFFPEFEKLYKSKLVNLSGGERRIIEIYLILVSQTKFCMLDEPFSQIMPIHVNTIKKIILREKENKGIIITDHMYRHIIDICDDLYVINNGQTYLTKSVEDIETLGYARIDEEITVGNNKYT